MSVGRNNMMCGETTKDCFGLCITRLLEADQFMVKT